MINQITSIKKREKYPCLIQCLNRCYGFGQICISGRGQLWHVRIHVGCCIPDEGDVQFPSYPKESGHTHRVQKKPAIFAAGQVGSQVTSQLLFPLNGFKEGLKITFPKTLCPLALDDFKEQRGPILHRLGENLQQVTFLIPVHQNA